MALLVKSAPNPAGAGRPPHPRGGVLEVFNPVGDSIAVVTVPETAVQPLHANEVLAVRALAKAG